MSESVSLPALGESVTEGTVTRWLKQVGDRVEVDEPLLEVSTDKVDTEIPSPVAGVIEEILVAEDETVEVGTALVRIGDGSGGGAPEVAPAAEAPAPEGAQAEPAPVQEAPAPAAAPAAEAPAAQPPAAEAPAQETPAQQPAPVQAPPAETAPAQASPAVQAAPAAQPAPAPAAEPAPTPEPESTEVPSSGAPAPGQEAPQEAPAPAEQVDQPPAAQAQQAEAPAAPQAQQPQAQQPEQAQPQQAEADTSNAGYVTPLVRKLANEKGVDLSSLAGTGVGGRIRKQDVLEAATAAAPAVPAAETAKAPTKLETSPLRGTTVPMSRLRKVVAERAVASMQGTAQLTTVVEADVTKIAAFRDKVKGEFQQKTGQKLSFLPFFAKAAVEALRAYPIINATVDGTDIVYPDHENLSIAVDTERGLLTPVVRNAGDLSIAELAGQIADLAARTRDNKLKPDELAGGTFTLTNTGSRGALFDTPLVFLPQVAILGTGIVAKKPMVVKADGGEAIAIRSTVYLALSYDHRIVDGADAARFLVAVKNRLEEGEFTADLGI